MQILEINKRIAISLRKQKIKKHIIKSSRVVHKVMILQLIEDGDLDNIIYKLNMEKIKVNCNSLIKKENLNIDEHFIYIIDNFITYFLNIFNYIDMTKEIISLCLNSDKNNFFSSKKYLYDNDNLEYYTYNYNLIIVNNFYCNYMFLKDFLKEETLAINLNIEKIELKNNNDIRKLLTLLDELNFVNKNNFAFVLLFKKMDKHEQKYYLKQWQILFTNYFDNQELIYEYRKFKEKSGI